MTAAATPETALRLGKFRGNGPALRLNMRNARDLWRAERKLAHEIARIPTYQAAWATLDRRR